MTRFDRPKLEPDIRSETQLEGKCGAQLSHKIVPHKTGRRRRGRRAGRGETGSGRSGGNGGNGGEREETRER